MKMDDQNRIENINNFCSITVLNNHSIFYKNKKEVKYDNNCIKIKIIIKKILCFADF